MNGKRGAIELSITTIVVVVIGITLLTLGLVWVSGIFDKLRGTTEGAFEKVDTQIEEILGQGSGKAISVTPSSISLEKGSTAKVRVILENNEEIDTTNAYATVTRDSKSPISCLFGDNPGTPTQSQSYNIRSGFQAQITVLVKEAINAPLGTYSCQFKVNGLVTDDPFEELFITVVK